MPLQRQIYDVGQRCRNQVKWVFNYTHWNIVIAGGLPWGEHATDAFQFTGVGRFQGDRRMVYVTKKRTKRGIYVAYCTSQVGANISKVFTEFISNFHRICYRFTVRFKWWRQRWFTFTLIYNLIKQFPGCSKVIFGALELNSIKVFTFCDAK